jgi:hypothetical protein
MNAVLNPQSATVFVFCINPIKVQHVEVEVEVDRAMFGFKFSAPEALFDWSKLYRV